MQAARAWVGTSGFSYDDWRGRFYPPELPARRFLEYYAQHFDCVEINATFYRMPRPAVIEGWKQRTPPGFRFVFKMPRAVSHRHRLARPEATDVAVAFLERIAPLGDRLGPVLVQLPPSLHADLERLEAFLEAVAPATPIPLAVEFRCATWWQRPDGGGEPPAAAVLARWGAAWVAAHGTRRQAPHVRTGAHAYWRFHGTEGFARGAYGPRRLAPYAATMRARLAEGVTVWAFFNNDVDAAAPRDAAVLRRLLDDGDATPPSGR